MNEMGYSINASATLALGHLVLDLVKIEKNQVCNIVEKQLISFWRSLIKNQNEIEIFSFLYNQELFFQKKINGNTFPPHSHKFNSIHIPTIQIYDALKLLSSTQKVYFKDKQLVIDLFGHAELYFKANQKCNLVQVEGRLKWSNRDIPLSECDAIGPGKPLWFVHGYSLKLIKNHLSWKEFQQLKQAPIILEGNAKHTFFANLDGDDESPKLIVEENISAHLLSQPTPYPVLMLKDRWGLCADLWMDYGNGNVIPFHDPLYAVKNEHGEILFPRQHAEETHWEKDLLETNFKKKQVNASHYYCPLDKVPKSLTFLLELGWQIMDWQRKKVIKQTDLSLHFEEEARKISVRGKIRYETFDADVARLIGCFNRKEQFIQLSHDHVGLIDFGESNKALFNLAEESDLIGESIQLNRNQIGSLDTLWDIATKSEHLKNLREKLLHFKGLSQALPASSFSGHLRPYQQDGVNWLSFLYEYGFNGILADEMGLGKTVQILAFLSRLPQKGPHLVVMPTSLLFNWRNEITQFLPLNSCTIHQGEQRTQSIEELKKI